MTEGVALQMTEGAIIKIIGDGAELISEAGLSLDGIVQVVEQDLRIDNKIQLCTYKKLVFSVRFFHNLHEVLS
ncbi:hypothetical protein Psal006b_00723 [Piscirickettsia salmonis]|uniref:Transposase n=2 Tax=Piscirickettsia salmonis TaxID=1238 RepID=A0AAC8ZPQ0_PISSA|nr:hypothetical protein [Piscirickettsia salmonis]AKP74648.1 hypothetical protein PSLF89_3150 [Piscirickettsia salmonis LF-89 = ATCC VR-1361]ALB23657.1 transposase [Piscirickettsia salmonis]ALY03519.1 hypothetical protein AWE47_12175 [Piscirickettsia salmonis]AMA43084.1 hypothetical protein AWJ11_12405 [Piscirickettsia salmonis]AOS35554.1 hypothetical protein AVM72_09530 [Piscirickettsia salmonis]